MSVPVGVVAWDAEGRRFAKRYLQEGEKVAGVSQHTRAFLAQVVRQLDRWASEEKVPYADASLAPTSQEFWQAAADVLTTAIRVDPPRAIDPMEDLEEEIEALYEAIVQPSQSAQHRRQRIDGLLTNALADLASAIPARPVVSAFGGAEETVRRGAVGPTRVLLIDGVNLAAARAREEADALVSRMLRIRDAYRNREVQIIVGYAASPGGLNGEAHMRDWIRAKVTDDVFDLSTENAAFLKATTRAWREIDLDPQRPLL